MRKVPKLTPPQSGDDLGMATNKIYRDMTDAMAWIKEAVEIVEAAQEANYPKHDRARGIGYGIKD